MSDPSRITTAHGEAKTLHGTPYGEHVQDRGDGQQKDYLVLTEEERAKGFVRPVRRTYRHVGRRPKYPVQDLTVEESKLYETCGYVKYEPYPPDSPEAKNSTMGRYWTREDLTSGCGMTTTMGQALSETYARSPSFYSGTYCCHCSKHFDVGADGEFVWVDDGDRVGT